MHSPLFMQNIGEGIDAREREKGGGKGRGKADLAAVLMVTLVVLLPNKAIVHKGAASLADGSSSFSSSSSLCAFTLVLLPLFFFVFFIFAYAPPPLRFLPFSFVPLWLFFFPSSLLSVRLCFSLFSPLYLFFFFPFLFSPPKLPKSVVSIPQSSLFFSSPYNLFFLWSCSSLCNVSMFFFPLYFLNNLPSSKIFSPKSPFYFLF